MVLDWVTEDSELVNSPSPQLKPGQVSELKGKYGKILLLWLYVPTQKPHSHNYSLSLIHKIINIYVSFALKDEFHDSPHLAR